MLAIKGNMGKIISPGTRVTFYKSGISGIKLKGEKLKNKDVNSGKLTVTIPEGSYNLEFKKI